MRNAGVLLVIAVLVFFQEAAAQEWRSVKAGPFSYSCIAASSTDPAMICAAGADGKVTVSLDGGESWETRGSAGDFSRGVAMIDWGRDGAAIYAAAASGIFVSRDRGRSWIRRYRAAGGAPCRAVQATPAGIFAGMGSGIVFSPDGIGWNRREMTGQSVTALSYSSRGFLFALTEDGIYRRSVPGGVWKKTRGFRRPAREEEDGDLAGNSVAPRDRSLTVDERGVVTAVVENTVIKSVDDGDTWEDLPSSPAIASTGARALAAARGILVAATRNGVYRYGDGGWEEISAGLAAARVSGLCRAAGRVYAASDAGVFLLAASNPATGISPISRYLEDEPDIAEVQRAAVEYADAGAEKIERWRKDAGRKAWLPDLNMGVGRETGDLWHWESGSTTKDGDDCLRKGKDAIDWSLSLTWELGDLIWSNDQTAIDTRSRLNAELRDQVLDEVTSLYYERIRLKIEIDSAPLEDRKKRLAAQVKLEEAAASLDGLTNGYYSAARHHRNGSRPLKP